MGIKTIEELKQIREQHQARVQLRHGGEAVPQPNGQPIEILVGMATCGIASGARETMIAIMEALTRANLENVRVIPVGCIGACQYEPIIQIVAPGSKPVVYGNVKKQDAEKIVQSHLVHGVPVEDMVIHVDLKSV